jgi:hypothetical protein
MTKDTDCEVKLAMSIQYIQNATSVTLLASVKKSSLQWQSCTLITKLLLLNFSGELHCLQSAAVNCMALLVYVAQAHCPDDAASGI